MTGLSVFPLMSSRSHLHFSCDALVRASFLWLAHQQAKFRCMLTIYESDSLSQGLRVLLSRLYKKLLSNGQSLGRQLGYRRRVTSQHFRSEIGIGISLYRDNICRSAGTTFKHERS